MKIDEIIYYLKWKYSAHNEEPKIFIYDIPSEEPSFEVMTGYLKTFSKFVKEDENMSLKHVFSCTCEDCISYFGEPATV